MYQFWNRFLGLLFLVFWISGCAALDSARQQATVLTVDNSISLPAHPLYVLAVSAGTYGNNELVIVDPKTWQVVRHTPLSIAAPWDFSRDPQGRIWIGDGAEPGVHRLVQVFAPDGRLLKTLEACADTYTTIRFAVGRAFIPCLENGFHAAVVVVDLTSLTIIQKIDIGISNDVFTLLQSSGNEHYFLMSGNGKITDRIVLVDTRTLATLKPVPIPPGYPARILTYQERFVLLNASPNLPPTGRQDLLILDVAQSPALSTVQLPVAGALWGTIEGDNLYTYHNLEELGMRSDPSRAISRLNLVTGETKLWPLPDRWNAKDIALVNGEIILAHSEPQIERRGLYRFDPATGKLTMLVNIPGAQRILPPAP